MLRRARALFPNVPLVQADLLGGLPFRTAYFTHVLCTQTLKHCPDLGRQVQEFFRVLRPGRALVLSVTHPDMDFTDYEMRDTPAFILSQEADIIHHSRDDYFNALGGAGFEGRSLSDVRVSEKIAHLLTPDSFARVRGRQGLLSFEPQGLKPVPNQRLHLTRAPYGEAALDCL